MGKNLLIINAGEARMRHGAPRTRGNVITLKARDSKKIAENSTYISKTVPAQAQAMDIKYGNGVLNSNVVGTPLIFLR